MSGGKLTAFQITARGTLKTAQGKPVSTVVATWPEKLHEPDGLKAEASGNILCAAWEHGIVRISPRGQVISQTVVSGQQIINLAFSPREKNALYLAAHPANNMSGSLVKIPWDAAGMA
jgi:sugar lactone lactonase YvrE